MNRYTMYLIDIFMEARESIDEPCCEKTGFLHMRKQRRRSAVQ